MSISDNSNLSPWHQAMKQLAEHAQVCVTTYPEAEWMAAMRNQAACLDLSFDVKDNDLEVFLNDAQAASNPDYAWLPGQQVATEKPEWILDGLIHQGYFHALYAPAKLGKTTLVLDFVFHLFSKQVQSFLNLKLNSFKNYTLYLIGPDMCVELWAKLLGTAGLLANDGTLGPGVKYVSPERNVDSLSDTHLDRYSEMALKAKANGEEPIFIFDCYSTMATNTPGMNASEVSDLYYKPLRKLKNAMSATGATTILLHHSSKSSRKNGAVDAAAGNSGFSRVPDVLIKLDWLRPDQNLTRTRDSRIVLNATGRIDPMSVLIDRDNDGHFQNIGDVDRVLRQAHLEEEQARLSGDYSRCMDHIGNCDDANTAVTVTVIANQFNWDRYRARRVVQFLERRGLVWRATLDANTGGRPAAAYRAWHSQPDRWEDEQPFVRPPEGGLGADSDSSTPLAGELCADKAGYCTHTGVALERGTKVDLKLPSGHWQNGWLVKDSKPSGDHDIWRFPNLSHVKCRQRLGIEIRVSTVDDDDEEL